MKHRAFLPCERDLEARVRAALERKVTRPPLPTGEPPAPEPIRITMRLDDWSRAYRLHDALVRQRRSLR